MPRELPDAMPDDAAQLWFLIRRLSSTMDREGEALFRRELGISLAAFLVLSVVDAHPGPLSQQAVADRLSLTKGTVSRQIEAAVSAGLMTVQTAAHTRRENALVLTERGTALVRRGDELLRDGQSAMRAAGSPEELATTIRVLQQVLRGVER